MKRSKGNNFPYLGKTFWPVRKAIFITLVGSSLLAGCVHLDNAHIQPTTMIEIYSSTQINIAGNIISSPTPKLASTYTLTLKSTPSQTKEPSLTITLTPWTYMFPVQPANRLVSYKEGVASHGYPAIDIFAPAGYEYIAVTNGTIEFISYKDIWDAEVDDPGTRGGIAIAIIGDDGLRYYGSHLSRIAAGISSGMDISAGEVLGYIGESGNAIGRGSHLHFGISRPSYPDDWKARRGEINPFPYLNAWAAGLNVTPIYMAPTPKPTP
jgi:murein DD-endopeptidase MepM/ murein hydrolase activator NlpD